MSQRSYHDTLIPYRTLDLARLGGPFNHHYDDGDFFDVPAYHHRRRRERRDGSKPPAEKKVSVLLDKELKREGDLGWSLDYATAYCYKNLNGNRPGVVAAINSARQLPVDRKAPYLLFDYLDKNLFTGKLTGMVNLRWKALANNAPGVTSAPKVVAPRVCIQLNSSPFEDDDLGIDDLLDALIHQMIHAYFLVCCGPQKKGAKQDGRTLDALNFGVIVSTINDISKDSKDGSLRMMFYADQRQSDSNAFPPGYGGMMGGRNPMSQRSYIAIDPRASTIGPPPADGQSHCCLANRHISRAQILNWQVESYAKAINSDLEEKGTTIHDLDVDGKLKPVERLHGPPSATYIELIWDDHRIMIPREKTLKFASLKKLASSSSKVEIKVPECSMDVLKCIWDFIQHEEYFKSSDEKGDGSKKSHKGPPIIVSPDGKRGEGMIKHIQVFKTADAMKFSELRAYALKRLYAMPISSDDPLKALKELYDTGGSAMHSDLQKWARGFLARRDGISAHSGGYYGPGVSNIEKLVLCHQEQLGEMWYKYPALKDDYQIVCSQMQMPEYENHDLSQFAPGMQALDYDRVPIPRRRSLTDLHPADPLAGLRQPYYPMASSPLSLMPDEDPFAGHYYFGRNGRGNMLNPRSGRKAFRKDSSWYLEDCI